MTNMLRFPIRLPIVEPAGRAPALGKGVGDAFPLLSSLSLEGDSITSQNITGTTVFNAIGFYNALNAISGHRFPYSPAQNFGVGGGTLTTMEASKVAEIGTMTGAMLGLLGGANDVRATMADAPAAATALATMKTKWTSLKDYTVNTVGRPVLAVTIPPGTQNAGVPLTALQLGVLKDFNTWLLTQHNRTTVFVADIYAAMCSATDTPNPAYFKDESGKLLHPNTAGALAMARAIWTQMQAWGFRAAALPDPTVGNLFAYGDLAADGADDGTISTNADGAVRRGLRLSGSGGVQKRTGSVSSNGQRVVFAPLAADGGSVTYILENPSDIVPVASNYAIGDHAYAWAELTINDAIRSDGPFLQVTDKNSGGNVAYYGMNKGGNTTGYMPADAGRLFFRTPTFQVAGGHTGFLLQVRGQINAATAPGLIDLTVHRMGIKKL